MAKNKQTRSRDNRNSGANLGFEDKLWQAADKMRGSMDAADYKHVVLGFIFLKYLVAPPCQLFIPTQILAWN